MRFAIPVLVLAGLLALFYTSLHHDPRELPSPLIGKPGPAFELPVLAFPKSEAAPLVLRAEDLKGKALLVNFFASWCEGCRVEHPFLMQLAQSGQVQIVGVDYKDAEADVRAWLDRRGNPYSPVLFDLEGKTGIDWGVYGVPETFVLNAEGVIVYKHVGAMTADAWERKIKPLLVKP